MQPKVSVVMPCYNKADYIGNMFDSIIAQKWDNIELILVNDGSTDGTREIIAAYEPKFHARGFEAVIIDQENQGVAAAVYEGLKRATGDYICQIDADDILDHEYVSAMAGYLERNPSCEWIVCDLHRFMFFPERAFSSEGEEFNCAVAESVLLDRVCTSVCNHMFRRSYSVSCGMLKGFPVCPCVTQEPQILLSLAFGGAKPFYIRRPLYSYIAREDSILTAQINYCKKLRYSRRYDDLAEMALARLTDDRLLRDVILRAGNLSRAHGVLCVCEEYDELEQTERLAEVISSQIEGGIDPEAVKESGFEPLARHFSNKLIGYDPPSINIKRMATGRIIAYAAYGKAACRVLYGLLNSNIRPDVFWDIAAKPNDSIDGIPVITPDFASLREADIVLVLLKDNIIAEKVGEILRLGLSSNHIFPLYGVMDYLCEYFYGGKYEKNKSFAVPGRPSNRRQNALHA
jgi:glycosyltransferase involved in cell wall biosynthesis